MVVREQASQGLLRIFLMDAGSIYVYQTSDPSPLKLDMMLMLMLI